MTNLAETVRDAVAEHAESTAVSMAGSETSYAEFWALTGRFAGALRERGVGTGDRIAIYLPNLPQFMVAYYGILRVGGVVVPIDPAYEADQIKSILANSTSGAIVTTNDRVPEIEKIHEHTLLQFIVTADGPGDYSTGFTEFLRESPDVDYWSVANRADDDVAVLAYTAGVTDESKGVLLTHGNLASNATTVAALPPDGMGPDDGALGGLRFFHTYGMTAVMNAALASGSTVVPMRTWDPDAALEVIADGELTILTGVPSMFRALATHPDADEYPFDSVRFAVSGGAPFAPSTREAFEETFDVELREGYGLTEASPVTHFDHADGERRPGSIGMPIDGISARVVNDSFEERPLAEGAPLEPGSDELDDVVGEIVISGPNVMKQYHEQVDVNAAAFTGYDGGQWLHTGDIGYVDDDGYFYFVDRKADVFEVDSETVYPQVVETALVDHEEVDEAGVVYADSDGEPGAAVAFVVSSSEGPLAEHDVLAHWNSTFDSATYPRAVELVSDLPRTSTGKLKRRELREQTDSLAVEPVTPDESEPDGVQDLDGISGSRASTLADAGYETVEDLHEASRDELSEVEGFGDALADRIKEQLEDDEE